MAFIQKGWLHQSEAQDLPTGDLGTWELMYELLIGVVAKFKKWTGVFTGRKDYVFSTGCLSAGIKTRIMSMCVLDQGDISLIDPFNAAVQIERIY